MKLQRIAAMSLGVAVLFLVAVRSNAQVATTNVQGTVYVADGSVASGTLSVSWPAFTTAANQAVTAGSISATIGTNGSVSVNLAPNSDASPAGTYYTAVYHLNNGTVSQEYWVVPPAASATIASVRAQLAPATVAVQPVSKSYVADSISAITGNYLQLAGGTMSGPLQLSNDPVSTNQAATKHYVDGLAATELPLTGGSLSGTLDTQDAANKLPRVDVTHPDFGAASGCANPADPTGTNDSTCAILAAATWDESNPRGSDWAPLYFPDGTYRVSSALRVSCELPIMGDGENTTIIEPVNNSANGFTIVPGTGINAPMPNLWTCNGFISNLTIHALGGHQYTATLLELDNTTGYTVAHVRGSNGGGRGLSLGGSTERLRIIDTEWDTIRWPIIAQGNELKFLDTQIESPGQDDGGYCFDANCVNGVYPGMSWTVAQTLMSANGNGTIGTYVVQGGNNSGSTNGISPLLVGHYFTVSGVTGATGLNGVYQVASVTNNSPSSNEYTITAANTTNGTGTVTGATYQPTILPDRNAAFYMAGAAINVLGGSIKSLWYSGCFETSSVFSGLIEGFYCEGYPLNGTPHENADIEANGEPPYTSTTGTISSNAAPVASTQWFPNYVNDPQDIADADTSAYRILPQDYIKGSTGPSAYNSLVQQGQYENVLGGFAGDGQFHISARNQSGSTAPTDTNWPSGSIVAQVPQGNYGTLEIANSHFNGVNAPGNNNWAADCNDSNALICGEAIVGSIPNGYTTFSSSGGTNGANVSVAFLNDEWWSGGGEITGEGWTKISIQGTVTMYNGPEGQGKGETSEVLQGQYSTDNVLSVQESDGTYAQGDYISPTSGTMGIPTNAYYDSQVDSLTSDPVLGGTGGSIAAGAPQGRQFASQTCWFDIPPSTGTHALNRWCKFGGPSHTTAATSGLEYDTWNGSTWQLVYSVNGSGNVAVTGSVISYPTPGTTVSSSNTFAGSAGNTSTLWVWNGNSPVQVQAGWQWSSNTASNVTPTAINYRFNPFQYNASPVPIDFGFGIMPIGSLYDFTPLTGGVKLPSNATVGGQNIVTDQYQGKVPLIGGTATVESTATPANPYSIAIWNCGASGTVGTPELGPITAGNTFVINSSSSTDTSTVCWWIH